ncbi:MAG: 2-oxo acid dehydrogenase subunit E2 [Desulfopila sp.]
MQSIRMPRIRYNAEGEEQMAIEQVLIPDFGDVQEITVVEVYIKPGESIEVESPLLALESEKAVMDIPSPLAGTVTEVRVKEGDTVQSGDLVALVETEAAAAVDSAEKVADEAADQPVVETVASARERTGGETAPVPAAPAPHQEPEATGRDGGEPAAPPVEGPEPGRYHATPSVRGYARELGVELATVRGSGPKGRIEKEDVQAVVKLAMGRPRQSAPMGGVAGPTPELPPLEDFSLYGEVEELPLGRIKKISGPHLHRSWLTIPHVTHFDEADISELETFRGQLNAELASDEPRFGPLVFIVKAVVATLKRFPLFNCSLMPAGDRVVLKHYYHIGIAVDTPGGLVVPVIRDADRKGLREIAGELQTLSGKAREGKLAIGDLQGASFTISSLGGIGGTGFTPIVNWPQVAILGLSRNYQKPFWDADSGQFIPRLTLPFSLSYDHRVIDGAEAARFCRAVSEAVTDLRRAML